MNKVRLILVLSVLLLLFSACGRQTVESAAAPGDGVDPDGQLLCLVQDRSQAEEVAALYGIALVEFDEGVAVFYTEEDPGEVIGRGQANGWPELSLNSIGFFA